MEFVPPATMSPKKATAETKVVHALKMGLPLLDTPPCTSPTPKVEDVTLHVTVPNQVEELEDSVAEPAQEQIQVQEPAIQHVPTPVPLLVTKLPTVHLPTPAPPVTEPAIPLKVKGKEVMNKVGGLVAHFEDPSRHKSARPPRMVEQTPISALVSTIRKGFEDMKPLPALEMVEEGDSVSMTPPPRPIGGLKIGGVRGLNVRSKLGLGERTALTAMQLNR